MPTYTIQAPNGKTYSIAGPAGATDDQVRQQILAQHPEAGQAPAAPAPRPAPVPVSAAGAPNKGFLASALAGINRNYLFGIPEDVEAAARRILPSSITGNTTNKSYSQILNDVRQRDNAEMASSMPGAVVGGVGAAMAGGTGELKAAKLGVEALSGLRATAPVANVLQRVGRAFVPVAGQTVRNLARAAIGGSAYSAAQEAATGGDPASGAVTGLVGGAALHAAGSTIARAARSLGLPSATNVLQALAERAGIGNGVDPAQSNTARTVQAIVGSDAPTVAASQSGNVATSGARRSVFENLPFQDREAVIDRLGLMSPEARSVVASNVRERANQLAPELIEHIRNTVGPAQDRRVAAIAQDIADSRGTGGVPTPDDHTMAAQAATNSTDMNGVADTIASNIMSPFDNQQVYNRVSDLIPQTPVTDPATGIITYQESNPDISAMIRRGFGVKNAGGDPLSVKNVTDAISKLRGIGRSGGIDGDTANAAADHISEQLAIDHPNVGDARDRMIAMSSKYKTIADGIDEGRMGRTRSQASTALEPWKTRQLYDTEHGATGRALGQATQLQEDILQSPGQALSTTQSIASNPTRQAAISANLGGTEGESIANAANAQAETARRLKGLSTEARGTTEASPHTILQGLMGLANPADIYHKVSFATRAGSLLGIPDRQANDLANALFSSNPTQISRGLAYLSTAGEKGKAALAELGRIVGGASAGSSLYLQSTADPKTPAAAQSMASNPDRPSDDPLPLEGGEQAAVADRPSDNPLPLEAGEPAPTSEATSEDVLRRQTALVAPGDYSQTGGVPIGHAIIKSIFPGAEITSDVRDPEDPLSKKNPNSLHARTQNGADVRPIPGMTFSQFIDKIHDAGYKVVEARDEAAHPIPGLTTGKHWHVVVTA